MVQSEKSVLLVIDVQYDFIEGGSLAVQESSQIIPLINDLLQKHIFSEIIFTKDFHPPGHVSFASSHQGLQPFTSIQIENKIQELWPDHCVQGTQGCEIHKDLLIPQNSHIIFKGSQINVDSYSGFGNNEDTGLTKLLQKQQVQKIFCVGLAYDFCVGNTALDALKLGYQVFLVKDVVKGIAEDSCKAMKSKLDEYKSFKEIEISQLQSFL